MMGSTELDFSLLEWRHDLQDQREEEAEELLRKFRAEFRNTKAETHTCKMVGKPATELCKLASEEDIDLIVVGSRGLTGLQELALGSVSHRVAHHAPCPVLIVRNKGEKAKEGGEGSQAQQMDLTEDLPRDESK